jgi:hypothetical protein
MCGLTASQAMNRLLQNALELVAATGRSRRCHAECLNVLICRVERGRLAAE